jgi:hypothetical protein
MKPALLLLVAVCLSVYLCGCASSYHVDAAPQTMDIVSLNPQDWQFFYGADLGTSPAATTQGAWAFQLPDQPGQVNYLETPFKTDKTPASISITFEINSTEPQYNGTVDPNDTDPAHFHLFFERKDDEALTNPNYRWWCGQGGYQLGSNDNHVITLTCPLTYDHWTGVYGQQDAAGFQDALTNVAWVGITFGGNDFYGHGVNLTGGQAQFVLMNYQVNY